MDGKDVKEVPCEDWDNGKIDDSYMLMLSLLEKTSLHTEKPSNTNWMIGGSAFAITLLLLGKKMMNKLRSDKEKADVYQAPAIN